MAELTAHMDLPLGEDAPWVARHAVRPILEGWGFADEDLLDATATVVSELVTNAVCHGGGCLELTVSAHDGQVIVSAADGSAVVPRRREAGIGGGRGIALIEALSQSWGVQDFEGGKKVFVVLAPYPGPDPTS
jgi:anti-sigma regulatory factor (Ser/Thr protein kinase)